MCVFLAVPAQGAANTMGFKHLCSQLPYITGPRTSEHAAKYVTTLACVVDGPDGSTGTYASLRKVPVCLRVSCCCPLGFSPCLCPEYSVSLCLYLLIFVMSLVLRATGRTISPVLVSLVTGVCRCGELCSCEHKRTCARTHTHTLTHSPIHTDTHINNRRQRSWPRRWVSKWTSNYRPCTE